MPDIDLDPGEYTERKPRGWRWKLPWSHPDDTKLPLVQMLASIGAGGCLYFSRDLITDAGVLVLAGVGVGFAIGGFFQLWLRGD